MLASLWRRLNVGTKITLGSLLSLLPMLVIAYTAFTFSSASSLGSSAAIQTILVRNYAEKIDDFLRKQALIFQEWTRDDIFGMAIDFQEVGEIHEEMDSNLAMATGMDLLLMTDLNGTVLYTSDPKRVALGVKLEWTAPLLKQPAGQATLSSELPAPDGKRRPTFIFSYPTHDTNGVLNGLFLAMVKWSALHTEMENLRNYMVQSGYPNAAAAIIDWNAQTILDKKEGQPVAIPPGELAPPDKQWFAGDNDLKVRLVGNKYAGFSRLARSAVLSVGQGPLAINANLLLAAFIPHEDVHGKVMFLLWRSIAIAAGGIMVIIIAALIIARTITSPIAGILEVIGNMGRGDLTHRCPTPTTGDEIVLIGNGINRMADSLEKMIRSVYLETETILAILSALTRTSGNLRQDTQTSLEMGILVEKANQLIDQKNLALSRQSDQTAQVIESVHRSTESLSENNILVASATEQASSNVATVAATAEQMSSNIVSVSNSLSLVNQSVATVANSIHNINRTLSEVRERCQVASQESNQAARFSTEASSTMDQLAISAKEISKVVGVINEIAEQSNMLALNAAIEAAGAGNAGKGFAVVSFAIKDLALQTARATDMVVDMVDEIQDHTKRVVAAMKLLSDSIGQIDQANRDIVQAMDEQSYNLEKITGSINEVAGAAEKVTNNTRDLTLASKDVSRAVQEASVGANEISNITSKSQEIALLVATETTGAAHSFQEVYLAVREIATASSEALQLGKKTAALLKFNLKGVEGVGELSLVVEKSAKSMAQSVRDFNIGTERFDVKTIKESQLQWIGALEKWLWTSEPGSQLSTTTLNETVSGVEQCIKICADHFHAHPQFQQLQTNYETIKHAVDEIKSLAMAGDMASALRKLAEIKQAGQETFALLDRLYLHEGNTAPRI